MTNKQREARCESQRMHNSEPKHKHALKNSTEKFIAKQNHTLHPDSIAMENPFYITESTQRMGIITALPQSSTTNNGHNKQAASMFYDSQCMAKQYQYDNTTMLQTFIANNDDEDGDIFDEDDEEDEGYLFAGQDEEHDEDVHDNDLDEHKVATDIPDPQNCAKL